MNRKPTAATFALVFTLGCAERDPRAFAPDTGVRSEPGYEVTVPRPEDRWRWQLAISEQASLKLAWTKVLKCSGAPEMRAGVRKTWIDVTFERATQGVRLDGVRGVELNPEQRSSLSVCLATYGKELFIALRDRGGDVAMNLPFQ